MTIITLNNIAKSYKEKKVLTNVNININKGDILGYIGENGTGKTTTIKIISGINNPDSGTVLFPNNTSKISVVFDFNGLYEDMTAYENLLFFCKLSDIDPSLYVSKIKEYLNIVNLYNEKDIVVKKFSKGMKRRLALARAIITEPNILILDEPFDGIDVKNHYFFVEFLKKWVLTSNRCVLVTSHNMHEIENLCNKVCFLENGQITKYSTLNSLIDENSDCIRIKLDKSEDINRVISIFKKHNLTILNQTADNCIEIQHNNTESNKKIINILIESNILFTEISEKKYNLEEIYMKKVTKND